MKWFSKEFIIITGMYSFITAVTLIALYMVVPQLFGVYDSNEYQVTDYPDVEITGIDTDLEKELWNILKISDIAVYNENVCCGMQFDTETEITEEDYSGLLANFIDSGSQDYTLTEVNFHEFGASIKKGDFKAVSVSFYSEENFSTSFYFYYDTNKQQFSNLRSFALPGFIANSANETYKVAGITDLSNSDKIGLVLKADSAIKEFFILNSAEINSYKNEGAFSASTADLFVEKNNYATGVVELVLTRFIDNEAGFMYIPDEMSEQELPEISPSRYIYVDEIRPNWYLYKTT